MGSVAFYFRKAVSLLSGEVLVLPSRTIVGIFCVNPPGVALAHQNPYVTRIIILTSIFAILAASWDLLSGFTGQMNFGHALFFGVGAYSSAILNTQFHIPPWGSVPIGAMTAVLAGLIIGIPCLRLKHTYLALTTLAFPIILLGIVFALPDLTGGELGISGVSAFYQLPDRQLLSPRRDHAGLVYHHVEDNRLQYRHHFSCHPGG